MQQERPDPSPVSDMNCMNAKSLLVKGLWLICVITFLIVSASASYSWVEPFKMGKGKFLSGKDKLLVFEDIDNNASSSFRNELANALGSQLLILLAYGSDETTKLQVIEFADFAINMAGREKSKHKDAISYLICISCTEGVPERELTKRKAAKNKYYDIWVLSGYYVLFEKDKKTNEYRLLGSGAAE
jgi:hypothetical protein